MKRESFLHRKRNQSQFLLPGLKKIQSDEERVLEYAWSHGAITRNDVIELLKVSTSTASRVIRRMVKNNLLKRNGKARNTNYTVINTKNGAQ